ncbi:outer membrane porin protein C [Escherichia coli]|uniref:Outer membrane porin protein C n=1 Tax=Escherichia coli TaxID=562 RepID=A0A376ZJY8_ECOLX|nr:outer membrane porin protein C [Escherichia coli]
MATRPTCVLASKGETQVTDQLTGYGQWEYQIQGNSAENENNSWTRVAFAGLKFQDVGSFDYGRNYGVVYDVTSWTDVLPEFGGDTYGSDNFMQQRGNGFATYRNTDFFGLVDGLNFAVQYQGKNGSVSGEGMTNNGRGALRQNGDGVGGSIIMITKASVSVVRSPAPNVLMIRTARCTSVTATVLKPTPVV